MIPLLATAPQPVLALFVSSNPDSSSQLGPEILEKLVRFYIRNGCKVSLSGRSSVQPLVRSHYPFLIAVPLGEVPGPGFLLQSETLVSVFNPSSGTPGHGSHSQLSCYSSWISRHSECTTEIQRDQSEDYVFQTLPPFSRVSMTSISDQEATTLVRKYLDNRFINLQLEDEGWLYTSSMLFILPLWNSLFLEILKTSPSGDLSCQLPARDR